MIDEKLTSIQLSSGSVSRLKMLKIIERETYEDVIKRLILNYEEHNNDR